LEVGDEHAHLVVVGRPGQEHAHLPLHALHRGGVYNESYEFTKRMKKKKKRKCRSSIHETKG
jgi:hypothetical protein